MNHSIEQLIQEIHQIGFIISTSGNNIKCIPIMNNVLPDEFKQKIRDNKKQIIDQLNIKKNCLSDGQRRMFYINQINPDSCAYSVPFLLSIHGKIDEQKLENAINSIVLKHSVLHTNYSADSTQNASKIKLSTQFVSSEQLERAINTEISKPFALELEAPIRCSLYQTSEDKLFLLINLHHICHDGWSIDIFFEELCGHYNNTCSVHALDFQYHDYAYFLESYKLSEQYSQSLDFWRASLEGAIPTTLPSDINGLITDKPLCERVTFSLTTVQSQFVTLFAKECHTTPFIVLLSFFNILLSRYTNSNDVVIATPIHNRALSYLDKLIGYVSNTLLVKQELASNQTIKGNIIAMDKQFTSCLEHSLVDISEIPCLQQLTNQIPVLFSYQKFNFLTEDLTLGETKSSVSLIFTGYNKADLLINFIDNKSNLSGYIEYNTELYSKDLINRFIEHFMEIINQVDHNNHLNINELSFLNTSEQQKLNEININDFPDNTTDIIQYFNKHVQQQPETIAIEFLDKTLSYRDVEKKTDAIALFIQEKVRPGDIIGISIVDPFLFVITSLAVLKLRCIYMPIDLKQPSNYLHNQLEQTKPSLLISDSHDAFFSITWPCNIVTYDEIEQLEVNEEQTFISDMYQAEESAYIMFTSGTTSTPKGVIVSRKNIVDLVCQNKYFKPEATDKVAQISNLAFDGATFELWGALLNGLTLVIVPKDLLNDPFKLGEFLKESQVSISFITTAYFIQSLSVNNKTYSSLRCIYVGGESIPAHIYDTLITAGLDKKTIFNVYGPTEAVSFSTFYSYFPCTTRPSIIPIGKPISHRVCLVMNDEEQIVPFGGIGELHIAGSIAKGYFGQPDLTHKKFIKINYLNHTIFYKTGDLVKFSASGDLIFLGRKDGQVKHRGYRIELEAINQTVMMLPEVKQSYIHLVKKDNEPTQLIAFLVLTNHLKTANETEHIKATLQQQLPAYMQPDRFFIVDEIPLNKNKKINVHALMELYEKQLVMPVVMAKSNTSEAKLATLWIDALGHQKFDKNSGFFQSGGDSLSLLKLLVSIQSNFDLQISLRELFTANTFEEMLQYIESSNHSVIKEELVSTNQTCLLNKAQQNLLFLEAFTQVNGLYHIPLALNIIGPLNKEKLRKAIKLFTQRHPLCHSVITTLNGKPHHTPGEYSDNFSIIDLSNSNNTKEEIDLLILNESNKAFKYDKEPLFRSCLITKKPQEHILLLTFHHAIADGWSLSIALNEIALLYCNSDCQLPHLTYNYFNYSAFMEQIDHSNYGKNAKLYWQNQLSDIPLSNNLPCVVKNDLSKPHSGEHFKFTLHTSQIEIIDKIAAVNNTTRIIVLFSFYQLLLFKLTKNKTMVTGTPIANRKIKGTEHIVGYFANTTPIRSHIDSEMSLFAFINNLQNTFLEAEEHTLPFEKIIESINLNHKPSEQPLFQTWMYSYNLDELQFKTETLKSSAMSFALPSAKYDLSMALIFMKGSISVQFEYATARFNSAMIRNYAGIFIELIEQFEGQDTSLEHYLQLNRPQSKSDNLYDSFVEMVQLYPERIAITSTATAYTYSIFHQRIKRLACILIEKGVCAEDTVAVLLPNSIDQISWFYACMQIGAIYAPIDSEQPEDRKLNIIEQLTPKLLINKEINTKFLEEIEERILNNDLVIAEQQITNSARSDVAYIIHTSGSTGIPKAVACYHHSVLNLFETINELAPVKNIVSGTVWTQCTFDVSIYEICYPLTNGGTLHVLTDEIRLVPDNYFEYLNSQQINTAYIPPFLLPLFLKYLNKISNPIHLQRLLIGVEKISLDLAYAIQEKLPNTIIVNGYGPTEATICCTLYRLPPIRTSSTLNNAYIPIGKVVNNSACYLLNEHYEPVEQGQVGELFIAGSALAKGYHNDVEDSSFTYIAIPHLERVYRTGDMGKQDHNNDLIFMHRNDDQVKIRGYRIELMEIQAALTMHYKDLESAILVAAHPVTQTPSIILFIVNQDKTLCEKKVKSDLALKLPAYMLPDLIINIEYIPITSHGKTDYASLKKIAENYHIPSAKTLPPVTTENDTSTLLLCIWKELLMNDSLTIDDDFFDNGGDSILAMQMIAYAKEKGIHLELKKVFTHTTVKELLSTTVTANPAINIISETYPLTPIQTWFFNQPFKDHQAVKQSMLLCFQNSLNVNDLTKAFRNLLNEYPILTMRFKKNNDIWSMQPSSISIDVYLNNHISFEQCANFTELQDSCYRLKETINYQEGTNFVAKMFFQRDTNKFYIYISAHHLVMDVVSWNILWRKLFFFYSNKNSNKNVSGSINYTAWSSLLKNSNLIEHVQNEIAFWENQTNHANVPFKSLNPAEPLIRVKSRIIECANIKQETVLALVVMSLGKVFNLKQVKLMLESHGRRVEQIDADLSESIGWFTCLYPMTFEVNEQHSFINQANQIKETLGSVANSGLGYGILKYDHPNKNSSLQDDKEPNILFNFLGRLEEQLKFAELTADIIHFNQEFDSDISQLQFPLEIVGYQKNNQLIVKMIYDEQSVATELIDSLLNEIVKLSVENTLLSQPVQLPCNNVHLLKKAGLVPIFLIHPINGNLHWYEPLLQRLDNNYTVYGLKCPQFLIDGLKNISLEVLAMHYAQQILATINLNPCIIMGWSYGGTLGFEIVKYIEQRGNRNIRFYAIDQPLIVNRDKAYFSYYGIKIDENRLLSTGVASYFLELITEHPLDTSKQSLLLDYLVLLESLLVYQPHGTISHVNLIMSEHTANNTNSQDCYHWLSHTQLIPRIQIINGDHFSIFSERYVDNLAKIINEHVRAIPSQPYETMS
ncbi:non-ribosomal peptide synthase [Legionella quateirensis]|uniref:Non-ribosomal peptide synthase n=2 Tax=Legionella quateirensis TaxID=45072 RepID=A0A378KV02_9GAMM|nr:non-ribosomal peptide synthase [Legionella quateirensis]STY17208.1 non-ribosomal peptide synthase [Legionella quateirensis]